MTQRTDPEFSTFASEREFDEAYNTANRALAAAEQAAEAAFDAAVRRAIETQDEDLARASMEERDRVLAEADRTHNQTVVELERWRVRFHQAQRNAR